MPPDPKHLDLIEGIINRLAGNSFQMKSWNVALATAAVGFAAAKDSHPAAAVFVVVPSLALWFLDAYYLALEKLCRDLYTAAAAGHVPLYSLEAKKLKTDLWLRCLIRWSVAGLHAPMIGVILAVMLTRFG
jgi:hypothetical protein